MILIAHNIRSLHNVGAIFRSADVFDVEKIYLTGYTGTPPRKEIAKVSLGSEHAVDWEYKEDVFELIDSLKKEGVKIVALENGKGSVDIATYKFDTSIALVLGSEVEGISPELLEQIEDQLEIAMPGRKQSLNVSVATGIALFALTQKER
jgi:23S rRNA (guanosine2251-2'-O)-methyltransferase